MSSVPYETGPGFGARNENRGEPPARPYKRHYLANEYRHELNPSESILSVALNSDFKALDKIAMVIDSLNFD